MDAKNYCRSIEVELYGWKAKMYDMVRKVDKLRSSDKEKVLARVEELHNSIADMEHLIEQLQTECPQQLGNHGAPEQESDKTAVADDSQQKADHGGYRQSEQRIQSGGLGGQQAGVHADHEKFAVGKIDDIHHTEDDRQAQGHDGQHHAEQQTGND